MLFPVLYIGSTLWKRTRPLRAEEMDFVSGLKEIEADTYDDPPPRNNMERFWAWLVRVYFPLHSSFLDALPVYHR